MLQAAELSPASKLAFRIVTKIGPKNISKVAKVIKSSQSANTPALVINENDESSEAKNTVLEQAINLLTLCKY